MYPLLSKLFPILLLVLLEHVRDSVSGKKCTKAGGPESLNYLATKRHYFYNEKEASKSTYTPNGLEFILLNELLGFMIPFPGN